MFDIVTDFGHVQDVAEQTDRWWLGFTRFSCELLPGTCWCHRVQAAVSRRSQSLLLTVKSPYTGVTTEQNAFIGGSLLFSAFYRIR